MPRKFFTMIVVGALALAACSDDDAADTTTTPASVAGTTTPATTIPDTTTPATTIPDTTTAPPTVDTSVPVTTTDASDVPTTPATALPDVPGLTLHTSFPFDSTFAVAFDTITDDHIIRRGTQGVIEQGQTFGSETDATLSAVTFAVVPAATIPSGTALELTLLEVGDPDLAVPSAGVPIDGTIGLVLDTPADLPAGSVAYPTFAFPGVELVGGVTYALVLGFADGAPPAEMYLQHAEADVEPSGMAIWLEGANWKSDSTTDQAIRLELV